MKLSEYIENSYDGNVTAFAVDNNYHVTQVRRFVIQGAYFNDGKPYFKKYLQEKSNVSKSTD